MAVANPTPVTCPEQAAATGGVMVQAISLSHQHQHQQLNFKFRVLTIFLGERER
jgi:hypothetical protein